MDLFQNAPVSGYQFKVIFDKLVISFSKVTNLSMEQEFEEFQEGGTNDRVLLFRQPRSKADVLRLERGVRNAEGHTFVPGQKIRNITIMVMRGLLPVKIYAIEEGTIRSVSVTDLNAMDGSVMIETLEILHTGLNQVKVL